MALTIAQLSGGWQLQDPLAVRLWELKQLFERRLGKETGGPVENVFTLAPRAIHSSRLFPSGTSAGASLPPELALAAEAMTSISTNMSVMLGKEPIPHGVPHGWAEKFQVTTDWLAQESRSNHEKRSATDLQFLADSRKEWLKLPSEQG